MRFRGFRIQVVLLVFLVVVALGLGVQYFHQQTQVIHPLAEQLEEIPGVLDVGLTKGFFKAGSRMLVSLEVSQDVPLALVFERVHQTLMATGGDYAVQLKDSPNPAMLRLFHRIQIALEEAIMTGEFTTLEKRISILADPTGIDWELGLDREFVYLSLTEGSDILRRVISRGTNEGKVIVCMDGGADSWTSG